MHLHGRIQTNTPFNLTTNHIAEYRYELEGNGFEFSATFATRHHLDVGDIDPDNELICATSKLNEALTEPTRARSVYSLSFNWSRLCRELRLSLAVYNMLAPSHTTNYGVFGWMQHCEANGLDLLGGLRTSKKTQHFSNADYSMPLSCVDTKRQVLYNNTSDWFLS